MDEMEEIIKEFLVESHDNLNQMDDDLVALEKEPGSEELLARVFRAIHTVKGTSGVLGFPKLESIAHVGENLLSKLRDGKLLLNTEITSGLLRMVDAIREILSSVEKSGMEGERDYTALRQSLTELLDNELRKASSHSKEPQLMGEILIDKLHVAHHAVDAALAQQSAGDLRKIGEILVEHGEVSGQGVLDALKSQSEAGLLVSGSSIRVDVNLLDKLMNLVGELVLARNQILQYTASQKDTTFIGTAQRLNLITTELQEGVMKTRMQPIGNVWNRFPRLVRDLALQFGKQVRVEMEGSETELDKTIVEAIKDPLTHVLRNAIDHGIELPEQRVAAGKAAQGRVLLRSFHEGGQVNIEVSDDGGGLNLARLKQKAVESGQVSAEQVSRMSDREVQNMIFFPGLSTAQKVTNVSGRGVGMDVVKTNIEKIGGTVDVQSVAGEGTTLKMKIPLTLAIIPALIATTNGERFAIPQVNLLELVRLEGDQASSSVEDLHGAPVYRLRGKLLPLVYLSQALQLKQNGVSKGSVNDAEKFQFDMARDRHRAWVSKLHDFVAGRIEIKEEEAGSHQDCALGKWLYGFALQRYSHVKEMRKLETCHRVFHAAVREAVVRKNEGHSQAAEQKVLEVSSISEEIVAMLSAAERGIGQATATNIVVLQADDRQFGLVVDEINDTEEIVVKPLGKQLKGIPCFAGATIMGDGQVALILDVLGIAQMANVVTEVREHAAGELMTRNTDTALGRDAWLVFRVGEARRMAIPLRVVSRLEEISTRSLEKSGKYLVVQYRGEIMPLLDIAACLNVGCCDLQAETVQVVVTQSGGRSIGLLVGQILDIVEQQATAEQKDECEGRLGSAVIQDRVTELLDIPALTSTLVRSEWEAR